MKILEELIHVDRAAFETVDGTLRVAATLSPHRDSAVYRGHFPGQPVTPGVLMLQAVTELLSQAAGRPLALKKVINVKYLAMMGPDDIDGATLAATLTPDLIATAAYTKDDKTYAKMKLTLEPMKS